jgi:hypothetical protein
LWFCKSFIPTQSYMTLLHIVDLDSSFVTKVKSNTRAHAVMCCLCHVKQVGSSASWKESHPQYQYLCIACWYLASRKGRAALWSQKLWYLHVILRHEPSAWNELDSGKKYVFEDASIASHTFLSGQGITCKW